MKSWKTVADSRYTLAIPMAVTWTILHWIWKKEEIQGTLVIPFPSGRENTFYMHMEFGIQPNNKKLHLKSSKY